MQFHVDFKGCVHDKKWLQLTFTRTNLLIYMLIYDSYIEAKQKIKISFSIQLKTYDQTRQTFRLKCFVPTMCISFDVSSVTWLAKKFKVLVVKRQNSSIVDSAESVSFRRPI